ncbi:lipopolysaccharide assembly protein LapB [Flavobacterium sp. TAB 87]|uniref:tetratricopeptide repeat protein n=1 Tax=Flavobacterium sp. TAB 87 TaxID=1729581 RepID=UPI00076C7D0E|nr:hypothetical protein [Flavobacterium sp. TAB 87]KVV13890.1 putative PEP-CTERM system TPR-repeat lipoprotein [Flavobacterium sp. TAB 87]
MKQLVIFFVLVTNCMWAQSDFEKGEKLFQKKQYAPARTAFESVVKTTPNNLKAIEYLGDIAGAEKKWDTALVYYKKLKLTKPSEADYFYKYGGALGMKALTVNKFKALGMIDEVKGSFEKSIQLDSKHIPARWALIELYLQLPAMVGGSESKAVAYSDQLQRISAVDGYLSQGRIDEYFKRYKMAEEQYKKAVTVGGTKICYQKLADLYQNKMEQPDKAKIVLEEYKKKTSN